ncbi:hypothetical protein OJ998_20140 [Solirubrobacter taibaiensis]|nr:hypothetical protein [Solirubrobacter taibaiensis]
MSATYAFLPWVQSGIARSITAADDPGATLAASVTLPVSLTVDGAGTVPTAVRLYGPGDITGLEPGAIARRDPAPNTTHFEAGYMPQVQFARGDLPWMFTPAAPGSAKTRLRPWLVLVTVRRDASDLIPGAPLPILALAAPAQELPDLSQSWAWAHGQINGLPAGGRPAEILASDPGRACSRLVCPRRLDPDTAYRVCLVPAFAAGVQAGLGQPVTAQQLTPAWGPNPQGPLHLPVYDSWEFSTGPAGSFETLARKLHPSPYAPEPIRLELTNAGSGLPNGGVIELQTALRAVGPDAAPPGAPAAFVSALGAALDGGGLTPPRYGQLQGSAAPWVSQLNLDPRLRIAAAAGARVVQERQESLMARAWSQAGALNDANAVLRQAQLARELGTVLVERHLAPLSPTALVAMTQPAHARIAAAEGTVNDELRASRVPEAAISGAMRRLASPQGVVAQRAGMTAPADMLAATDAVAMRPPAPLPGGMIVMSPTAAAGLAGAAGVSGAPSSPSATAGAASSSPADSRPALATAALRAQLLARLAPEVTVLARTQAAIAAPAGTWTRPDPLAPADLSPRFPEPMYDGLLRAAPELFLPEIGDIEVDGVALLETTPTVIEAYMAGLNHELSRELLWREFPATLAGTAFRQFWEGAEEDIPALASWGDAALGTHLRGGANQVVLLVRGELLRRFPTTTIYAAQATAAGVLDPATRTAPLFRATIGEDVVCIGFPLSEEQVLAGAGWFFAFEQYAGDPRFGFDDVAAQGVPKTPDQLAWPHIPVDASGHADVTKPINAAANVQGAWGKNAAATASLTFQQPFRVALHASRLIARSAA